jgi:hypothetical protein
MWRTSPPSPGEAINSRILNEARRTAVPAPIDGKYISHLRLFPDVDVFSFGETMKSRMCCGCCGDCSLFLLRFQILHFFNTPPQVTETELVQVFQDYDVVPPKAVKLFPMKSERSSSGLLEFEDTTEAVAAVMACNHAAIESPGKITSKIVCCGGRFLNDKTHFIWLMVPEGSGGIRAL